VSADFANRRPKLRRKNAGEVAGSKSSWRLS
jgi:hypothetical protein